AHLLADEPAEKIRGPARREGNDERDLPRRIGLRRRERNKKHEKCRGAGDTPNMQFHVLDPSLIVLMHPCAAQLAKGRHRWKGSKRRFESLEAAPKHRLIAVDDRLAECLLDIRDRLDLGGVGAA